MEVARYTKSSAWTGERKDLRKKGSLKTPETQDQEEICRMKTWRPDTQAEVTSWLKAQRC